LPVWPDELAARLGYSFPEISECVVSILAVAKLNTTQLPAAEVHSATTESYMQSRWGEDDASCEKDAVEEGSPRCATALF